MASGSEILVAGDATRLEGYVATGVTCYPGQVLQIDPTVALKNGRHTWKLYAPGADGDKPIGPFAIVDIDFMQGKTQGSAYAAGERVFLLVPEAGAELNVLLADIAGTADAHAAGEVLIVDNGTGKMIATTGTPESKPFILLEAISAPTSDTYAWVYYNGY